MQHWNVETFTKHKIYMHYYFHWKNTTVLIAIWQATKRQQSCNTSHFEAQRLQPNALPYLDSAGTLAVHQSVRCCMVPSVHRLHDSRSECLLSVELASFPGTQHSASVEHISINRYNCPDDCMYSLHPQKPDLYMSS